MSMARDQQIDVQAGLKIDDPVDRSKYQARPDERPAQSVEPGRPTHAHERQQHQRAGHHRDACAMQQLEPDAAVRSANGVPLPTGPEQRERAEDVESDDGARRDPGSDRGPAAWLGGRRREGDTAMEHVARPKADSMPEWACPRVAGPARAEARLVARAGRCSIERSWPDLLAAEQAARAISTSNRWPLFAAWG